MTTYKRYVITTRLAVTNRAMVLNHSDDAGEALRMARQYEKQGHASVTIATSPTDTPKAPHLFAAEHGLS